MNKPHVVTYAQNREDLIIQGFFDNDETGFYVDVGAEAPTDLSVTKIFYDRGWRGINIEPIKKLHSLLLEERPRDINLNIGISDKEGTLLFREYEGTGYSTFSNDMKEEHKNDDEKYVKKYHDYEVEVRTLSSVLADHGNPKISFMKIDVEGLEYEVLSGNDWESDRPEVICIEANHVMRGWREILKKNDYGKVFFDGLNEYYADKRTKRAEKFNYVEAIIYKEPIVNFRLLEDFREYDKVVAWLEGDKKDVEKKLEAAIREIQDLNRELEEIGSLSKHLRKTAIQKVVNLDNKVLSRLQRSGPHHPPIYNRISRNPSIDTARLLDKENFASFSKPKKTSPLLPIYSKSRTVSVRVAKNARRLQRKIRGRN